MDQAPQVLLIEDSNSLAMLYSQYLRQHNYQLVRADCGQQALEKLRLALPEVVLLDLTLPDMPGMDILRHITDHKLPCSVVVITAHNSVDIAVEAMRLGAFDFLTKPFDSKRLCTTVRNALKHNQLNTLITQYQQNVERQRFAGFIGSSLPMQEVYRMIHNTAPSKATVFITGESGTGKEVCAEAIHQYSPRKDHPFIALNCAAIPRDLMESEIFGHIKGAFTGAQVERKGAANMADGGTLFLDEICELDLELQSKLLRFIQTGTFQRVGSSNLEKVDVRFICATNRDPFAEVQAGRFREDLYYRLHVIPLNLPPLRERGEDILLLARHMLSSYSTEEGKQFTSFDPQTTQILLNYRWPGNVRELQNVIRNIVVLHNQQQVTANMLPATLNNYVSRTYNPISNDGKQDNGLPTIRPLWLVEKEVIEQAITQCGGNIPQAAAQLQISPSTIYRKKLSWSAMLAPSLSSDKPNKH